MIHLGVDPGSKYAGLAVMQAKGGARELLALDFVEVPSNLIFDDKILFLAEAVDKLLVEFSVDFLALEESFVGKNTQSALRLAELRGAISYVARKRGVCIEHFATRKIKKSITGNGNSSKEQVAFFLKSSFHLQEEIPLDLTDALALAYHASINRLDLKQVSENKNFT